MIMNCYRTLPGWEGTCKGLRPNAGGISTCWAIVAVALLLTPIDTRAQDDRPWRQDGEISIRSIYDDNIFRLTDSQKNNLGSGSDQFTDMLAADEFIVQIGIGGEIRHGPSSRLIRLGGGATLDAHTRNTRRTHVSLDAYLSQTLSKRDEITVKVELAPYEFRRNYLGGADAFDLPIYQQGVSTAFAGEIEYARRLIGGSGPDLDVEIALLGENRSVDELSWRDRSSLGGRILFDLKVNSDIDAKVEFSRSRASYSAALQPVIQSGLVTMATADKDFNDTRLGGELRFDLIGDTRLTLEYERRMRTYLAEFGVDPAYGGREDARNSYGAKVRYEISSRINVRIGGRYQEQVTFRPASGSTGDEIDYERTRLTLQLVYSR